MEIDLRLRPQNATVERIDVPKDRLDYLKEVLASDRIPPWKKEKMMKETTGQCCICGKIPEFKVIYAIENATRIEKYCDKCVKSVYAREQVL